MIPGAMYQPGDRVRVELGAHTVVAEVLEDRGTAGAGDDRVLRIGWTPTDSDERVEIDVPASRVTPEGVPFEEHVRSILEAFAGADLRADDRESPTPDFVISTPKGTVLVEAKVFPGDVAPARLLEAERELRRAMQTHEATDAVLVVPTWNRLLTRRPKQSAVSVVSVGQLQDWLSRHAA